MAIYVSKVPSKSLLDIYILHKALTNAAFTSGLTPDHPTLTTYFEGEIIGPKYTFQTRHTSWGATDKTDMQHWARFPAWRPLAKQAKKPDFHYKNSAQRENIFMRWKESFLVPDHRVREILGASFEGFYYICFNQVTGNVSGIYFHARSEKYVILSFHSHLAASIAARIKSDRQHWTCSIFYHQRSSFC